jgi:predicted TIM-barrel fold metal-dependent hydrolase
MMTTVADLFSTGMPARFPKLQIILTEAGLSCFAHSMMRLDWAWEQRRGDVPYLEEKPSAYMRRQMYYATQPIEEPESLQDMADVIEIVGEDTVVFASDYPHHDFDHPKKVFDIPVSAEVKRKIMGENALRALNIPYPSVAERVPLASELRAG